MSFTKGDLDSKSTKWIQRTDIEGIEDLYDCVKKLVEEKGMSVEEAIKSVKMIKALYPHDDIVKHLFKK